jgi:archaellum component FlaC
MSRGTYEIDGYDLDRAKQDLQNDITQERDQRRAGFADINKAISDLQHQINELQATIERLTRINNLQDLEEPETPNA